jgi:hypothetical protein
VCIMLCPSVILFAWWCQQNIKYTCIDIVEGDINKNVCNFNYDIRFSIKPFLFLYEFIHVLICLFTSLWLRFVDKFKENPQSPS